jgi:hypothetical protein
MAVLVLIPSAGVLAVKPDSTPAPETRTFSLPPQATEVASGVYYLGTAFDKGRLVEGYAFVRYRPGYAKPPKPGKPSSDTTCYTYLAKEAKWKAVESYLVDPKDAKGLSASFIRRNIAADIDKWEEAAGVNILGDETSGVVDGADTNATDGKNEVMFGAIDEDGVIAVTIVWGYFSAPPPYRELIEWDQVYDAVDFKWSSDGAEDAMDFENIATHELGHSVGMGDLYTDACSEQTMYGYARNGETIKRDLASGDLLGIHSLYS